MTQTALRVTPHPVSRDVLAPVSAVWEVLADGWSYASWVVGTARIRAVDDGWPHPGTCIHHSFGSWPLLLDDETEVLSSRPHAALELVARGRPAGEARVRIELLPLTGERCQVVIAEDAVSGPGALVPPPVRHALIAARNRETLRRLAMRAEGQAIR